MQYKNNPLSPHLQIYKWQISSLLSIAHRIIGVINILAITLICIWVSSLFLGEENYEITKLFYQKNYEFRKNLNSIDNKLFTNDYEPIDLAYSNELYKMHPGARKFYLEKNLISLNSKYNYDLEYYHDNVVKNYWEHPNIGIKSFNLKK